MRETQAPTSAPARQSSDPGEDRSAEAMTATPWTRASSRELAALGAYFLAVVLLSDLVNVRLGVELMTVVVVLAALLISREVIGFLRDWWFFLLGLVLWNLSGPLAAASPFPVHLDPMVQFDRWLFLGHDPVVVVQHHLAPAGRVVPMDVLTAFVYNLHLPEPYIAGYFLWRLNRLIYLQFAASVLTLLVLGFVSFVVFPAMPPWMASEWYARIPGVFNRFGPVIHAHPLPFHGTPLFYLFKFKGDAVAAFPSEHAAIPLLEYLAFSKCLGGSARWLLLWVGFVLFTVVYLGEHWVTDVLAGWLYAAVIFLAIRRLTRAV